MVFILCKKTASRKMFCLILALFLFMTGCKAQPAAMTDILTQKVSDPARTPITVLVKYAFSINGFEAAVEKQFPEIDIIQVGNYTGNMGTAEYEARLEHDDLTDVVMTWPIDPDNKYLDDRLLDLAGMDFTSRYHISALNNLNTDGALYYLPGPAQVRGIIYNKTLFEEKGWEIPSDFEGFIALCKTIEASGIRSIQLGFGNAEVLDTAFIGYNYESFFSKPEDAQWLSTYNNGGGSFGQHFGPALDVFQRMHNEGIWKESDLNVGYSDREKMFFTRQCAMVEDSVLLARMGYDQTGIEDEFALMPFYSHGDNGDWARLYMVCHIGINKHLAEKGNEKKYDLTMRLMDYISTPEGQAALASDTGSMFSSLVDASLPDAPEVELLLPALAQGRYAVFPVLKNSQDALREGLAGMLRGTATKEDVIKMVDQKNSKPPIAVAPTVFGTASDDFSIIETGNFVTDAMRKYSGCEIALFLDNGKDGKYNGKGISARLYKGEVTEQDISRILPDLKQAELGVLWSVTMSGADLIKTLEHAIPVYNNAAGWFYYFSGLKMTYDPTAVPGERISSVTTADGKPIEPEQIYSIAVMDQTVPEEFLLSCDQTTSTIASILKQTIEDAGTISPNRDGRFTIGG